ncbi:MAG: twin-arginine translocase TatA/TatE family subunit [Eggerthellaceae bacterium]|nr:twin-arginine translocase TatA/TatE family subunit [Eggerthellaceae bacterium]
MKILGLGVPELLIILLVVLVIFGPKNLPKLGKAIGGGIKNLRAGMKEGEEELAEQADQAEKGEEKADSEAK